MPGVPPTQGMPRSLAGRNLDGVRNLVRGPLRMPGSFVVPEGPASAVPTSSGLGGRGAPLSRRPENLERARAATRRTLQGRMINDTEAGRQARNALRTTGPQAVPPGSTGRRKDDREEPLKKIGQIDNHELFDVEASGNGVIDRTAAPLAVKSGPALGGS